MVLGGLIVDAGGVLLRNGPMTARRRWEAENGRPVGFLDQALRQAVGAGWQGGRGEEEIRRRLTRYTGIAPGELAGLLQVLTAHERLDTVLADYLLSVRPGLATAVLANAGPHRRAELVSRFGLDAVVDLIVVSAEEGVAKPDPDIYLLTCRRLGLAPGRCLFVDDKPANVEGARRVGMHAELFSTVPALAARVAYLSGGRISAVIADAE